MATIYLKRPNKKNQSIIPTRIFNDVSQKTPFWWVTKSSQSSGQTVFNISALPLVDADSTSVYGFEEDQFKKTKLTWQKSVEANREKTISHLGERLRRRREAILASGIPLLDWDGVDKEKSARRGGYQGE
jgi:hypothetical protein